MFGFLNKNSPRVKFDSKVLRKNNISLLTLDERWNSLFKNEEKPQEIARLEDTINQHLKDQARLNTELKGIPALKKKLLDRIMVLTPEAFDNGGEEAKKEMQQCEKEIKRLNERLPELEGELDKIPERIKETNLQLLEYAVTHVYFKISADRKRVRELDALIEETRNKLKEYIDEKEALSQDDTDIYSYFHDLLGGEELEKLDKEHFGG